MPLGGVLKSFFEGLFPGCKFGFANHLGCLLRGWLGSRFEGPFEGYFARKFEFENNLGCLLRESLRESFVCKFEFENNFKVAF